MSAVALAMGGRTHRSAKARTAACGREQDRGGRQGGAEGGYAVGLWLGRRPRILAAVRSRRVVAVSAESSQTRIDAAHAERRADANLSGLFRAHTSPIFYRRSLQVANLEGEVGSGVRDRAGVGGERGDREDRCRPRDCVYRRFRTVRSWHASFIG